MKQMKTAKKSGGLIMTVFVALCSCAYFTSYITRYNYSAAMAEIIRSLNITKEAAGAAATGLFITYGLGQLISGWLGDRFKPENVLFCGLVTASLVNFGMAFAANIYVMTVLWCINGMAQAMLWPPLVKIMAGVLTREQYDHACLIVTIAASCGSIGVYLLVPLCIKLSGWQASFVIPAVISMVVSFVWIITEPRIVRRLDAAEKSECVSVPKAETAEAKRSLSKIIFAAGLMPIMVAIILQGILRDGITTWMPTFISDVYNLDTTISILTTVILPIFAIVSITAATKLQKLVGGELKASFLMFMIASICAVFASALIISGSAGSGASVSAVLTVICMTLIAGCMHGINLMLIGKIPAYFTNSGRVSTISGILNTFTYVGSAISGYGFAVLSEKFGWGFTVGSWVVIAVLGMLACLISMPKWNNYSREK